MRRSNKKDQTIRIQINQYQVNKDQKSSTDTDVGQTKRITQKKTKNRNHLKSNQYIRY